jgi:polar amino acid transport system substrate-binding protein
MRYNIYIKENLKKLKVQPMLLTAIVIAMIEFIFVSFISYGVLMKIELHNSIVNNALKKLTIINISMVILFLSIILLLMRMFKNLNYYAFYSSITELPNKNFVTNNLIDEISKITELSALISLDMDNFKAVNDTLGHLAGDELLKQAARRFKKVIKLEDCICHIGGDEFIFFIKSSKSKNEIENIAKNIVNIFEKPFVINGENVDYVTASLGIALIPRDGNDFQTVYNCADDAMYSAKNCGKNNYKFYDSGMGLHIYEETIKKREIEEGIRNEEFKVFYQPKFSKKGNLTGAEALVRWFKSNGTIVYPSEFIDFAQQRGLIISISELVVKQVCKKVISWIEKGYKDFTISINITAEHLVNEKLCKDIIQEIKTFNVPLQYIEFEITESMIVKDFEAAVNNIIMIKNSGIKVSMDDFGTGYSSLNYLKNLPINTIKIDKSFIDSITQEEKDRIILKSIINISHSFNYNVVAEGVENKEQFEILRNMDCDIYQGYYFGKPVDENTFENMFLE